jgi:Family of unknown function (DUF5719)
LDHATAGAAVRRGAGTLAVVLTAVVLAGAAGAKRLGPAAPEAAAPGRATSWIWICPHGGGRGWTGTLALANPGRQPVRARITALGEKAAGRSRSLTVQPGEETLRRVPAGSGADATYVEVFGGWLSAGWSVRAADPTTGVGAEPCAPAAGRTWYAVQNSSQRGDSAYLVISNPFAVDAVFAVAMFKARGAPVRLGDLSEVTLRAGRSMVVRLDRRVSGQSSLAAEVDVKRGRVAVASLGVKDGGGVTAVLGATAASTSWYLPTTAGVGQSSVDAFVPDPVGLHLEGSVLSETKTARSSRAIDARQSGLTDVAYPLTTEGPSVIVVRATDSQPFVAAVGSTGQSDDDAANGGTPTTARSWVVPPTVSLSGIHGQPSVPGLVVANPGTTTVHATLRLLPPAGERRRSISISLGPRSAAAAPKRFLSASPRASVLVTADGDVVALGGSTSGGVQGLSLYGLATGVPVPANAAGPG